MTHQNFQVYAIWHLCPSSSRNYIFASTGMWVQAIGLFAQATCAPEFGLPRPFNQKSLVLHIWWGCHKRRVKQKKKFKKKSIWLTVFSSKNIDVHVTLFYHFGKFVFLERRELSRIGVIWLNQTIKKNPSTISRPWKILYVRINRLFHSSLLQGCENKTTMDTSEPYTGAMKGTMHKPQANLGAD